MDITKPSLTELTTKYYIRHSLKEVRKFKDKYISICVNIFLLLGFVALIGGILYYKYRGKLTDQEQYEKEKIKKHYIFSKLHRISHEKQKEIQTLITNLPTF